MSSEITAVKADNIVGNARPTGLALGGSGGYE
jgi:hypothetical protein